MNLFLAVALIASGVEAKEKKPMIKPMRSAENTINLNESNEDYAFGDKIKKAGKKIRKKFKKVSKKTVQGVKKTAKGIAKVSNKALTKITNNDELRNVIVKSAQVVAKILPAGTNALALATSFIPAIGPFVSFTIDALSPALEKFVAKAATPEVINKALDLAAKMASTADTLLNPTKPPMGMTKAAVEQAKVEDKEIKAAESDVKAVSASSDEVEVSQNLVDTNGKATEMVLVGYGKLATFIEMNPNLPKEVLDKIIPSMEKALDVAKIVGEDK